MYQRMGFFKASASDPRPPDCFGQRAAFCLFVYLFISGIATVPLLLEHVDAWSVGKGHISNLRGTHARRRHWLTRSLFEPRHPFRPP
jgi:hypothetical protein